MYLWNRFQQIQWGPHFKYDYFWGHSLKSLGTLVLVHVTAQGELLGVHVTCVCVGLRPCCIYDDGRESIRSWLYK